MSQPARPLVPLLLALAGALGACGPDPGADGAELEVLVAAYRHVYAEAYASWSPSVVADFGPGPRPETAVSPSLEAPFAEAAGVARVPEPEREIRCDGAGGDARCSFNGHDLAVRPRSLRVEGDEASLTLEFAHPTPCDDTEPPERGCVGSLVADGYRLRLERSRGRWQVVEVERWFT